MARRRRWLIVFAVLSVACGGAVATKEVPPTNPSAASLTQTQDRQTISGRFSIITGDPPPDSGQPPQRRYMLTESSGRRWTLLFDETIYTPPGGIHSYNGKDVEVAGRVTGADRLLVESMRVR